MVRDDRVLARFATSDTRSHAEALAPAVRDLLAEAHIEPADLDGILTGTGPGPFTGLRAGIVTARTLGFAWQVPVYGMCSLDALAFRAGAHAADREQREILVAIDARRKELYWRRYTVLTDDRGHFARPADEARVGPPEDLPRLPAYGSGAGLYAPRLAEPVPGYAEAHPTAAQLARAAWALTSRGHELSEDTSPLYLRESDAKVPAQRKKALR